METIAPAFPKSVARAITGKINSHVNAMIGDSRVVQGRWDKRDDAFGIFEKKELQLGKLLGSGGFSNVYEVLNFEPEHTANTKYGNNQVAARRFYKENATKNGQSKYVVKHLKMETMNNPSKFCMAAADLVVEAQFLSSLNHYNILKIRGWTTGGVEAYSGGDHNGYFLILDRLSETLDKRIETWKMEQLNRSLEFSLRRLDFGNVNTAQLLSRTKIARQIASALEYLHKQNLIFRDLKPNNVGFDEFGTVKIFDFGLSRELPDPCVNANDVYDMSGKIGTVRYMAPEVALSRDYNQKVDTYSWAMLYWGCITLEKPYADMSRAMHMSMVCSFGQRPDLTNEMPDSIKDLLKKSWSQSMYNRLTMSEVRVYLELIEKELQTALDGTRSNSFRTMSRGPSFRRNTSNAIIRMAA